MKKVIRNYKVGTWGYWLFYHGKSEKWFSNILEKSREQLNKLLEYHKFKIK